MRSIVVVLILALALSSLGFAQFTFGPGNPTYDCDSLGTSKFSASGTYTYT